MRKCICYLPRRKNILYVISAGERRERAGIPTVSFTAFMPMLLGKKKKNTFAAPNALSALCAYHSYENVISFSSLNLLEVLNKDAHWQSKKL